MDKIRLGILGIGNQGSTYSKKILDGNCPEVELVAICDCNPKRIAWAKENLDAPITCFENAEAMLDSGLINACIVAVPHYDHPKYAMACMRRGIHVLVEKPAGVYTKQVREMNEEAKKHDVVFAMMFNQRTNHIYRKMRELVQSGEYGQIRRTNWLITNWYRPQCYYDSGDWRATWKGEGGGVLMNQCPHQLDLWQWICGMPVSVTAFCEEGKYHNIEVEDNATIFAKFENGADGVFITTTGEYPGTNRLEISGSLGKLVLENGSLKWWQLDTDERQYCFAAEENAPKPNVTCREFTQEKRSGHQAILQNFTNALRFGEPLLAPGYDGLNQLMLQNAAYLSAWKGCTVQLPFDEGEYDALLEKRRAEADGTPSGGTPMVSHDYHDRWQIQW